MDGDRRLRILGHFVGSEAPPLEAKRLCEVCVEVTGVDGAGIMLMSGEMATGSLCSSNQVSALIEELQYELGEGPCVDAYREDRPVLEPDLANPRTPRWMGFSEPAIAAGVRAVFGFPMQVGSARVGALNLYCARPGALSFDQHADALVLADLCAQSLLVMQANATPGMLAAELEAGVDLQSVIHQAAGMISVQLGVRVDDAMVRLRAYAFANERRLVEVARDVVHRRLRFDPTLE